MIDEPTIFKYTILLTDNKVPVSPMGRCPKLTRYKIMTVVTVFTFLVLLMATTMTRLDEVQVRTSSKAFTFYSISLLESSDNAKNLARYPEVEPIDNSGSKESVFINTGRDITERNNQQTTGEQLVKKRLPSAIVIGARKAGTRALLRFINLHPDVVVSRQETHFFDRYYEEGLEWYRHQMPFSYEGQVTLEKTPNYFVDWEVPERVYNFNSSIKLILIVRNPIDRAVSDYVQLKEKILKSGHGHDIGRFEDLAFDKYTGEINKSYAPIRRSIYSRHLEKWLRYFHLSQLLVVDGENIKVRPWEEMKKLEIFLGLSPMIDRDRFVYNATKGFYCVRLEKRSKSVQSDGHVTDFVLKSEQCLADSKGRDHPVLHNYVRQELLNFF